MKTLNKLKLFMIAFVAIVSISTMSAQCTASFTYTNNGGGNYSFTNTSTGSSNYWSNWNFHTGGSTSIITNPSVTFPYNTSYVVQLQILDTITNCSDWAYDTILVTGANPCPINSSFTFVDNGNGNYVFTNTSVGGTNSNWSFGDGTYLYSASSPSHTFTSNGIYEVCSTRWDTASSCNNTFCDSIVISNIANNPCNLVANFAYVDNGGGSYTFNSSVTGGTAPYTYGWTFDGNGATQSALQNPTYVFPNNAVGGVYLSVTDANGCTAVASDTVTFSSACNISTSFTYVDNGNGNYSFMGTSAGASTPNYDWNFGDWNGAGNSIGGANATHTFSSNGTYNVCLNLYDTLSGCFIQFCDTILVTSIPTCNITANFTYVDNGGGNYTFNPSLVGTTINTTFFWNFGDGTTSNLTNPSHTFMYNTDYPVSLQVIDSVQNCYAWNEDTLTISGATPCSTNASFTYVDNGDGTVDFTNTSTGGNATYWNLGNGTGGNFSTNFTSTYSSPGTYYVCINHWDTLNPCSSYFCDSVVLTSSSPSCNITASFTISNMGNVNGTFLFNSTVVGGTAPYTYSWSFGDGNTSPLENPIYTYTNGLYNLILTVTDANGCTSSYMDSLQVSTIICNNVTSFTYADVGNGTYMFTNTSTGSSTNYHWSFGDGTTLNSTNAIHTFATNGTFGVVLTVENLDGSCYSCYIDYITVTGVTSAPSCNAGFSVFLDSTSTGVTVINSSTGSNLTYFWDFGDGNTSTQPYPAYTYSTNGPFLLCLTVDNGNGCTSTYCDSINSGGVVFKQAGFTVNMQAPIVTGIEAQVAAITDINIYPNPVKDNLTIQLDLNEATRVEVFVTDMLGNKLSVITNQEMNSGNNQLRWTTNNVPNGIYLLNIKTDNSLQVKKLVVNR